MSSMTTYKVVETIDLQSSAPETSEMSWSEIQNFFNEYMQFVIDDSGYGHLLSSEEIAESFYEFFPDTLLAREHQPRMAEYFLQLAEGKPSSGAWKTIADFDIGTQLGYFIFVKCRTQLNELNALKLLVTVMNGMLEDMYETSSNPDRKFFFQTHTIDLTSLSKDLPAMLKPQASIAPMPSTTEKKVIVDFL